MTIGGDGLKAVPYDVSARRRRHHLRLVGQAVVAAAPFRET
jgi:hypothetical protein